MQSCVCSYLVAMLVTSPFYGNITDIRALPLVLPSFMLKAQGQMVIVFIIVVDLLLPLYEVNREQCISL